jgi:hypothetical protein
MNEGEEKKEKITESFKALQKEQKSMLWFFFPKAEMFCQYCVLFFTGKKCKQTPLHGAGTVYLCGIVGKTASPSKH